MTAENVPRPSKVNPPGLPASMRPRPMTAENTFTHPLGKGEL